MKPFIQAIAAIALSLLSTAGFSKSETVRLEIVGSDLAEPLQIADPATVNRFSIWRSPGIDWSRGVQSAPQRVKRYTVTFHQAGREPMHEWHRRYVVTYAIDADTDQGYIYLPGPQDGEIYKRNTFSIVRDIEGNWFHASREWEESVRPLIEYQSAADRELAAFKILVSFDAASNQVVLKCTQGCAWTDLTWNCGARDQCSSSIDASGMTR